MTNRYILAVEKRGANLILQSVVPVVVQIILRVDQQIDMSVVIVNIYSLKENSNIGVTSSPG